MRRVLILYNIRQYLLKKIENDLNIPCYAPANGESVNIDATHSIPISVSRSLLKRQLSSFTVEDGINKKQRVAVMDKLPVQGLLVANVDSKDLRLLEPQEAMDELGLVEHDLNFESKQQLSFVDTQQTTGAETIIQQLFDALNRWLAPIIVERTKESNLIVRSLSIHVSQDRQLSIAWSYKVRKHVTSIRLIINLSFIQDEDLASTARSIILDTLTSAGIVCE